MDREEKKNLVKKFKIYMKVRPAYRKFVHELGEISAEEGENPFLFLIQFLEASLAEAKNNWENAKKEMSDVTKVVADALGVSMEELKSGIQLDEGRAGKIIEALEKYAKENDLDDVLDF